MQVKMTLPMQMKDLTEDERATIVDELRKALNVTTRLVAAPLQDKEHNIWIANDYPLLADAEEELYHELFDPVLDNMASLIAALGLADEKVDIEKALDYDFLEYETDLVKGKKAYNKLSELWKLAKKKRKDFIKYLKGQNNWSKEKLKQIDNILKRDLPNYEAVAEKYAVRAAFISKIRSKQETESLKAIGTYVDRFPSTIKAATDKGIVLTAAKTPEATVIENMSSTVTEAELEEALKEARAKRSATMHNYTILPLQPEEIRTVENAEIRTADKIAEIADRHRSGIKQIVLQAINGRWTPQQLAQALFKAYGDINRDWRRVAITELAMASNDAYLAGCAEGDQVIVPNVEGSCKYCKQYLEGKTFTVTQNPKLMGNNYDQEMHYVWVGKTNYGRRVATYIPCVPLHPNCRHRYHKLSRFYQPGEGGKPVLKDIKQLIQEERMRRGMEPDPNLV